MLELVLQVEFLLSLGRVRYLISVGYGLKSLHEVMNGSYTVNPE